MVKMYFSKLHISKGLPVASVHRLTKHPQNACVPKILHVFSSKEIGLLNTSEMEAFSQG